MKELLFNKEVSRTCSISPAKLGLMLRARWPHKGLMSSRRHVPARCQLTNQALASGRVQHREQAQAALENGATRNVAGDRRKSGPSWLSKRATSTLGRSHLVIEHRKVLAVSATAPQKRAQERVFRITLTGREALALSSCRCAGLTLICFALGTRAARDANMGGCDGRNEGRPCLARGSRGFSSRIPLTYPGK